MRFKGKDRPLLIIGGNAAGLTAATHARRKNPSLPILILEKTQDISYSNCSIPFFISGEMPYPEQLYHHSVDYFREQKNIQVLTLHEVVSLFPSRQTAAVIDRNTGKSVEFHYESMILAMGASPVLPFEIAPQSGVFPIRNVQDAMSLKAWMNVHLVRDVVIVGGGYIGLEMADAFLRLGKQVTLVESKPHILFDFEPEIRTKVHALLLSAGVRIHAGQAATGCIGNASGVRQVLLRSGGVLECDLCIAASGIKPNSGIAGACGIELTAEKAIRVNTRSETSHRGIYAAGDCAGVAHQILKRIVYHPLAATAYKQGRIAGINAPGGTESGKGVTGTIVFKILGAETGKTGLTEQQAQQEGFSPVSAFVEHVSRSKSFPGSESVTVKMVADRKTGKLLGVTMLGQEGVAKRLDVAGIALMNHLNVKELMELDFSYAPPVSPSHDPLFVAAQELHRRFF